jgi:hypothetical protein
VLRLNTRSDISSRGAYVGKITTFSKCIRVSGCGHTLHGRRIFLDNIGRLVSNSLRSSGYRDGQHWYLGLEQAFSRELR